MEWWADFTRSRQRRYLHVRISMSIKIHDWFKILVWSKVDPQETSPLLPQRAPSLAGVVALPGHVTPNSRTGKTSIVSAAHASVLPKRSKIFASGITVDDREPFTKLTDSGSDSEVIPNRRSRKVMRKNRQVLTVTSDADFESPVPPLKSKAKESKLAIETETLFESVRGTRAWSYIFLSWGSVVFQQVRGRRRRIRRPERLVGHGLLLHEHLACMVRAVLVIVGTFELKIIVKLVLQRIMTRRSESANLRLMKLLRKIRLRKLVNRKSLRSSVLAWRTGREKIHAVNQQKRNRDTPNHDQRENFDSVFHLWQASNRTRVTSLRSWSNQLWQEWEEKMEWP